MFVGAAVALCFAIYVAMTFPADVTDWVAGLVEVSPVAGAVPIVAIALVGSCAQGALCVYGTGLDTSSIFPALKRVPATLLIGGAGTALVFVGSFAYNLVSAASAFLIILIVVTAPWLVINLLGYAFCRGRYYAQDLQVFNLSPRIAGGAYWFSHGWNIAAMLAWLPAIVIGDPLRQHHALRGAVGQRGRWYRPQLHLGCGNRRPALLRAGPRHSRQPRRPRRGQRTRRRAATTTTARISHDRRCARATATCTRTTPSMATGVAEFS